MIYDKELVRYKNTNFRHPKGLITFQPPTTKEQQQVRLHDRMIQQIKYFTNSIHGVCYIWEKDFRWKERLFWLFVVIAAVITCIIMYMSLASRHNKQQIKTVVETSQMPIYKINFPAVALCPWDHVNWLRYKAAEEKFLPPYPDKNLRDIFYDVLQCLDDMNLSRLDRLALLKNQTIPKIIDEIPLYDLANFMAFRCDELFVECVYDDTVYDCCKIFVAERTEKGICMVFNSMVSEESRKKKITDAFYPWKIRKAGEGSGLKFTLRFNKTYERQQATTQFGIDVMIKESDEWSESLTHFFLPNTKSYLAITPTITETSTNTRRLPPHRRRCIFADEKSNRYDRIERLPFNQLNCYVKCQQKNLIKICNCTLTWFFPKANIKECTVSDFQCIYENRDIFTYIKKPFQDQYIMDSRRGLLCDCVDNCYSLVYLISLNSNMLPNINASYPQIQGDIYIGQGVVTKYEARLDYTVFDLIAQFGGILGLSLGASILSLAEVVYAGIKILVILFISKRSQARKIKPKKHKAKIHNK
ncbi:pickpocket protein 19 [Lucilia cuprina]|uniref:pickpocket protein 19 n=1 Tax=Lucilia cuprina TaxID=7375 RepID=UPI001F068086|nr:pickpocket protein 19 [Lucilia cuprina]